MATMGGRWTLAWKPVTLWCFSISLASFVSGVSYGARSVTLGTSVPSCLLVVANA